MADAEPFAPDNVTSEAQDAPAKAAKPKRRIGRLALMVALPLVLVVGGGLYWLSLQGKVSTDNAYVQQDKVSISAEVAGRIVHVAVKEGQTVTQGDLLFRIDPAPFRLQIQEADAQIALAQASVTALENSSDLSGADISAANEDIGFAQATLNRQQALWRRGFTTKADLEAAQHAVAEARERLRAAQARQEEARARLSTGAQVPDENPQIAAGKAQRAVAQLSLSRTEVRAPLSGRVAQADRLQQGQQLVQGVPVLTLVATETTYVEANFKETDLDKMAVGQPAEIRFDAYPNLTVKGHVMSIGAGTGSEFSVLPAQNATGNWVKVTQRVPVRIAIDGKPPRQMIAGLSTDVTVFTDGRKR
ncbi:MULTISPECIES: HlyD family secretion protein [Bacteria]|uniref:HlyD family secretion protein n=1 Tax=Bacteria TaxID=2 RepID=UPI001040752C|nr:MULTISPECIES: HlyD family secretion protein [Bacteria]QDM39777.1 HlyD family secretion protein [Altererythrobacter sp. TH136]TCJ39366.1 HlyD family secretion protein [Parafrankia sp. BMG5.11]